LGIAGFGVPGFIINPTLLPMNKRPVFKPSLNAILALLVVPLPPLAGEDDIRSVLLGEAILDESAYSFLEYISDEFGPRMVGTPGHGATMDYLEGELQAMGLETERQAFTYPGWVRGESRVELLEPQPKLLRSVDLAYVGSFEPFSAEVAFVEAKDIAELDAESIGGRILLVRQNVSYRLDDMETLHEEHGVKGMLYINRVNGGQLLARTANHVGKPTPFPVFSISQEEGLLMQRLLEDGKAVRVELATSSELKEFTGINLIARLPGQTGERILLGAHFDSWDLGQGALDNGLGVAQLYAVAKLLKAHRAVNLHAIEFVWFDAEELGLWGSRHYAEAVDLSTLRAMVNLDMVGRPVTVNAMGFNELVGPLEVYAESLGAWKFSKKVENKPWLGSDHHPFIMKGVPAITFNAPMDHDDVRYYHDFGDTLDKVDGTMLGEACGMIALLVHDLANAEERVPHLDAAATAELFREAGLEERLKKAGQWPFGDDEVVD
jgi:Iap family predicted aminopeptidase